MKCRLLLILLAIYVTGFGQDAVYLTDGSLIKGKVLEIGLEEISIKEHEQTRSIDKRKVVLIHYQNGQAETFNLPEKEVVVMKEGKTQTFTKAREDAPNLISFNMLGLVNADLMFFYERLFFSKRMGAGAFAGYNFNPHINYALNPYMAPLANPKKHGDLGLFLNIYRRPLAEGRTSFIGLSVKYTPISFTNVFENSVTTGTLVTTNLVLTPGEGKQFSMLFHFGKHRQITQQFFIRTMIAFGFFKLTGDYKTQYNYMVNRSSNMQPVEFNLLPKMFITLNAGYNF